MDDIFEDPTSGAFNKKALEAKWRALVSPQCPLKRLDLRIHSERGRLVFSDLLSVRTCASQTAFCAHVRRPAVKKINTVRVESAYPTIVQSGGRYNLKANAEADDGKYSDIG